MFRVLVTFLIIGVTMSDGILKSLGDDNEGKCSTFKVQPVRAKREFIDSLHFTPAGSRVPLYHLIKSLPQFPKMNDEEFFYDACFNRNVSGSTALGYGFGQLLATFRVTTRPGIYGDLSNAAMDTDPSLSWDRIVETVTLTDHRNFAFLAQCFPNLDLRGWSVISRTPNLDSKTWRIIEEHAASLGFSKEKAIFFRFDSCRRGLGNPNLRL